MAAIRQQLEGVYVDLIYNVNETGFALPGATIAFIRALRGPPHCTWLEGDEGQRPCHLDSLLQRDGYPQGAGHDDWQSSSVDVLPRRGQREPAAVLFEEVGFD